MNKKLLTAAIGAAIAAGPMLAQADVKLYGKVHVSVDFVDLKAAGGSTGGTGGSPEATTSRKHTSVSSNASRWGLDISEKLGGGMTAIAKLEQQINADGDSNSQDTRNRYVGLDGKFGRLTAGVMDTPFKDISRAVDLFGEQLGDNRNLVSATGNGGYSWDLRPANSVQYISPGMNGFNITYQYSADVGAAPNGTGVLAAEDNRRRVDSIGLKYSKGPLYVAYAYETHRFNTIADGANPTEKGQRIGASYNFGAFKLLAMYQNMTDMGGVASGSQAVKRNTYQFGGAFTAGNNVFKAQYVKAGGINGSVGTASDNTGAKMWAIGWDHLFSKTTKAYINYAKTDNDSLAAFSVNGPSAGARTDAVAGYAGNDPSGWSIGMIVDF